MHCCASGWIDVYSTALSGWYPRSTDQLLKYNIGVLGAPVTAQSPSSTRAPLQTTPRRTAHPRHRRAPTQSSCVHTPSEKNTAFFAGRSPCDTRFDEPILTIWTEADHLDGGGARGSAVHLSSPLTSSPPLNSARLMHHPPDAHAHEHRPDTRCITTTTRHHCPSPPLPRAAAARRRRTSHTPGLGCFQCACQPTPALQGCVWTGDCPVGGCADRCIANVETAADYPTIRDRAFSEEFFSACPQLSYIYTALQTSSRRRRLLSHEVRPSPLTQKPR